MGCCLSQLACCCGPESCNLPIRESTSTRLMYTLFLVFTFTIQCVMQIPSLQIYMDKQALNIPDSYSGFCLTSLPDNACYQMLGFVGVYKVGFAVWAFHVLLMLLTFRTNSSSDCRATLHNGFWFFKFLILCGFIIGATFIPSDIVHYWFFFGLPCGLTMTCIQFHDILKKLTELNTTFKMFFFSESTAEKNWSWKSAPIIILLIVYSSVIGAYVLLFHFYYRDCGFHQVVIGITLANCGIIILAAILQRFTNKRNVNLGLIQTPAVCFALAFYGWSTITSVPSQVEEETSQFGQNVTTQHNATKTEDCHFNPNSEFIPAYLGVALTFVLTVKGSLGTSGQFRFGICAKQSKRCPIIGSIAESCVPISDDETDSRNSPLEPRRGHKAFRDEANSVMYTYSYFHLISSLAALLLMMHLTGWLRPDLAHLGNFNRNLGTVGFKVICIFLCAMACKPWPFRPQDDKFRTTTLAFCFKIFK